MNGKQEVSRRREMLLCLLSFCRFIYSGVVFQPWRMLRQLPLEHTPTRLLHILFRHFSPSPPFSLFFLRPCNSARCYPLLAACLFVASYPLLDPGCHFLSQDVGLCVLPMKLAEHPVCFSNQILLGTFHSTKGHFFRVTYTILTPPEFPFPCKNRVRVEGERCV